MKKVLLFAVIVIGFSCINPKSEFKGLGSLNIGTEFAVLPVSKSFNQVMDDEFNLRRFKLSEELGEVSDLNVTTDNGKIAEVKFSNNEATNTDGLEQLFENLKEEQIDPKKLIGVEEGITIKSYQTTDGNIFVTVLVYQNKLLKNGQSYTEYSYLHKDAVMKNHLLTLKSMGKTNVNRQHGK